LTKEQLDAERQQQGDVDRSVHHQVDDKPLNHVSGDEQRGGCRHHPEERVHAERAVQLPSDVGADEDERATNAR
jgi:hypothetical protein